LLGLSELLNDNIDVLSEDEIKQSAKMINQAAYNAYTLLENLLEWSRSQRGIMTFNPQNLMLFKEVEHQIHQAADQAVKKQIQFINDIDPLSVIFADQHMLQSILRNLISNGLKFSNPGNHIRIYYQKPTADSLQLIIEDQGIGMDSSKLKQLFSLESKGEKGTGNEPGSGLGLILVKEFMEKHGGNVAVESEQGKGSKFMLNFPISHRCKEIENLKIVHYESEK
jgi:signal transduction histidine kinase